MLQNVKLLAYLIIGYALAATRLIITPSPTGAPSVAC